MSISRLPFPVGSVTNFRGMLAGPCFCLMLGALLAPRPARACSTVAPPPVLKGIPADGDAEVPTDVRPVYDLSAAGLFDPAAQAPRFELTDSSGEIVALASLDSFVWTVELVPARELKPMTRYTLRGTWSQSTSTTPVDLSLSFTTGVGPLAVAPIPPVASMQHYAFHGIALSSCDPWPSGTCLGLPAGSSVQLTYIDSAGQETGSHAADGRLIGYLVGGPYFTNLSGVNQGTPFECAKLRARGTNGSLSAPVVLCGKDFPAFDLGRSANIACTPDGLTQDSLLVAAGLSPNARLRTDSSSGCSVARGAPVRAAPALLMLLGFVVLRHRRRFTSAAWTASCRRRF